MESKGLKSILSDTMLERGTAVDNTAPISQILDQLVQRERHSKSYRLYHQLMGQRRNYMVETHYTIPGHPLKNYDESWDGDTDLNYFEEFAYRSTMPKMITEMKNLYKPDPVTEYLKIKKDWEHGNTVLRLKAISYNKDGIKIEQLNDEVVQCPQYIVDLATRLDSDPDPYFTATYNWYYAGNGNMQLVCVNWVDYILHSNYTSVYLSHYHEQNLTIENKHSASFDCGHNIFETICSTQNIIALRTKHTIFILKISEMKEDLCFENMKQFDSEIPFSGISFDKYHTNILYAITIDKKLTIINLDRMTGKTVNLRRKNESLLDNWNTVTGVERASYMHIGKNAISLYDKRTHKLVTSWDKMKEVVDMLPCSTIYAAKHCEDSPSLYFTTEHNVFLMDTRASKTSELKVVQRWTHGLRSTPTYIAIKKLDSNKDLIVLSSQWCEDTCLISNYADSVESSCDIKGVSLPFHPPDLLQTLDAARLKLLCCDYHNPIESRLTAATTGQCIQEQGDNLCLLTQNSFGDIYLRTVYPRYMESFIEDDSVQQLHQWSQSFKVKKKVFEVSSLVDIADVWKNLKHVPKEYSFNANYNKDYYDESKVLKAFENEEIIPELLDEWVNERNETHNLEESSSLMLNLHYEDSDDE